MILIITHRTDYTADFVIEKLNKRGLSYFRFNCENMDEIPYLYSSSSGLTIDKIDNIHSVWFRRTKLPDINLNNQAEKLYLLNEYDALLNNFYYLLDDRKWLSHPFYVYRAENKLYQHKIAKELGLKLPNTIVTNQSEEVKKFAQDNNHNIIIKPLNSGQIKEADGVSTIFTNRLNKKDISNIHNYAITPAIFQEYIEKDYELRITVVNDKVFSARVDSQQDEETKTDWRKKKLKFTKYQLPDEIANECIELTKRLNISFGAIDMIKSKKGEYVFLEINPNGQWAWLEMDAGLKISDEIITYLTT
jgi:glutathione synthase/RimK-type ligase-like ATP-grasp enzyme